MTRKSVFVLGLIAATAIGSGAYADANHGRDGSQDLRGSTQSRFLHGDGERSGMMGAPGMMGRNGGMMQMMQMHASMMGGQDQFGKMGDQGQFGMMGDRSQFGMMGDRDKFGMMDGRGQFGMTGGIGQMSGGMSDMFDADGDGSITPDEVRDGLKSKLAEYDANGDGSLSIAEFEALNSAMIREAMVDRFQFFDNDGDGQVTEDEMSALANRMDRVQQMRAQFVGRDGTPPAQRPGQNMPMGQADGNGPGTMMNNN